MYDFIVNLFFRQSQVLYFLRHFLHSISIAIMWYVRAWQIWEENRPDIGPPATPILAVYNEFPLDCIAITGKQIAPSISQIAGSENEISQSGLLVRATFVGIAHAHDARARVSCTPVVVGECTSSAVELAARGSSRMNQPECTGDFYDCVIKVNNR